MSRITAPQVMVGNEFVLPRPVLRAPLPSAARQPVAISAETAQTDDVVKVKVDVLDEPSEVHVKTHHTLFKRLVELMHHYSVGVFALLFLLVGIAAIQLVAAYSSSHIAIASTQPAALRIPNMPQQGPNAIVPTDKLKDTLHQITNQPLSLVAGAKTIPVSPDVINSWLQVVADRDKGVSYIHVKNAEISKSLTSLADPLIKTPIDQVTVTRADGGSRVIVAGRDGAKLGDTKDLTKQIGQSLLGAKGMQLNLPLENQPFNAVTPTAFGKMIEVDVNTKQMWAYENGQVTRTFLISAGAPSTPTPIGQYKIYSKPAIQDMKGFNPDGSKYFQPRVKWINYFLPGGYAIHGNYWRPASVFGTLNTSHGCVSLPESEAKWIYDWAPIGTTVITHH